MPDRHGFNHLVDRGAVTLECVWCRHRARPSTPETILSRHARKHKRDVLASQEEARKERETIEKVFTL